MKTVDFVSKIMGIITAAFLVGVMVASGGCNAVSGLGRDLTQTSDMIHSGIRSYYSHTDNVAGYARLKGDNR